MARKKKQAIDYKAGISENLANNISAIEQGGVILLADGLYALIGRIGEINQQFHSEFEADEANLRFQEFGKNLNLGLLSNWQKFILDFAQKAANFTKARWNNLLQRFELWNPSTTLINNIVKLPGSELESLLKQEKAPLNKEVTSLLPQEIKSVLPNKPLTQDYIDFVNNSLSLKEQLKFDWFISRIEDLFKKEQEKNLEAKRTTNLLIKALASLSYHNGVDIDKINKILSGKSQTIFMYEMNFIAVEENNKKLKDELEFTRQDMVTKVKELTTALNEERERAKAEREAFESKIEERFAQLQGNSSGNNNNDRPNSTDAPSEIPQNDGTSETPKTTETAENSQNDAISLPVQANANLEDLVNVEELAETREPVLADS